MEIVKVNIKDIRPLIPQNYIVLKKTQSISWNILPVIDENNVIIDGNKLFYNILKQNLKNDDIFAFLYDTKENDLLYTPIDKYYFLNSKYRDFNIFEVAFLVSNNPEKYAKIFNIQPKDIDIFEKFFSLNDSLLNIIKKYSNFKYKIFVNLLYLSEDKIEKALNILNKFSLSQNEFRTIIDLFFHIKLKELSNILDFNNKKEIIEYIYKVSQPITYNNNLIIKKINRVLPSKVSILNFNNFELSEYEYKVSFKNIDELLYKLKTSINSIEHNYKNIRSWFNER